MNIERRTSEGHVVAETVEQWAVNIDDRAATITGNPDVDPIYAGVGEVFLDPSKNRVYAVLYEGGPWEFVGDTDDEDARGEAAAAMWRAAQAGEDTMRALVDALDPEPYCFSAFGMRLYQTPFGVFMDDTAGAGLELARAEKLSEIAGTIEWWRDEPREEWGRDDREDWEWIRDLVIRSGR